MEFESRTAHVYVRYTGTLPPVSGLLEQVSEVVPDGVRVVLDTTVGQEIKVGTVGQG